MDRIASGGSVTLADRLIRTVGDAAYELGTEHVDAALADRPVRREVRVTNLYRREGGAWPYPLPHRRCPA